MNRLRPLLGGMAVAVVVVLTSVAPASAHDELLSSSPVAGENLPSPPEEITLTYSADVLDMGAEVVVADGDGTDWVAGDPVVASGVVSVPLQEGMPDAGYEVRWRVVSSDGHPISGLIPFTVGDGAPLERTAASPTAAAADDAASVPADAGGIPRPVLVGAAGAVVAVVAFLVLLFVRRAARGRRS
ncbi:copper resistance CopC family protein [Microbacterium sp. LMI1-1-1.1]|uniref:copper resistance CopC family protein n=1 Tax=unclassified Microbacterium TaxID=2609290 RepID=UPI003466B90D